MKKYLFLLIFGLSLSQLYAQKEKHFFVRINGSYWQCNKETPNAGSNEYGDFHLASNPSYINTSVSFGKKISAELLAGFGLHYRSVNNKIEDNPAFHFIDNFPLVGYTERNTVEKTKTLSPYIFISFTKSLNKRFDLSTNLYLMYSFVKYKKKTIPVEDYSPIYDLYGLPFIDYKNQFIKIGVNPSLKFQISKAVFIELSVGFIDYKIKTKDSRIINKPKNDGFSFNFKPEDWMIGIWFEI